MGYVRDRYSEIDFEVNEYFLNNLRDNHNIDVNPESGQFTFDLTCKSEQGDNGEYNSEEVRTRITVHRTFHPDRLTNNQIGMIGKSANMKYVEQSRHLFFSWDSAWRVGPIYSGLCPPLDIRQVQRDVVFRQ